MDMDSNLKIWANFFKFIAMPAKISEKNIMGSAP